MLFNILEATPDSVYVLVVREMNADMNRLLYERWTRYQDNSCCEADAANYTDEGNCKVYWKILMVVNYVVLIMTS